jgi:hypothetical protein
MNSAERDDNKPSLKVCSANVAIIKEKTEKFEGVMI